MFIRTLLATTFLVSAAALPAAADVTEAELKSISTPDKVETPIGTMEFFDGVPTDATVSKVYDNLDLMRGLAVSHDVYFAPEAPAGKEGNWLQTIPGKSWFTILRMYGPLEPWINQAWRPGEIELVE